MQSIKLRAIEPEDLDWLYRIENDENLWGVGSTNVPYSRYALHSYIANNSFDIFSDKQVRLLIELADTHEPIGIVDLVDFDPIHSRAEVGIVVTTPYRQQGFAKEALLQLVEYARNVVHLNQIYAVTSIDNIAANQLFRSLRFVQTAQLPNWLRGKDGYIDALLFQLFL